MDDLINFHITPEQRAEIASMHGLDAEWVLHDPKILPNKDTCMITFTAYRDGRQASTSATITSVLSASAFADLYDLGVRSRS
jgi:hypothetical protein